MSQIGNVSEINLVKTHLARMKEQGMIKDWEIPYEQILTRLTAAVFFLTPEDGHTADEIWGELGRYDHLCYQLNEEKLLSSLEWQVEFNKGLTI